MGNILLSIIKFIIGFLDHSQAVAVDAVNSLSDTSTGFIILCRNMAGCVIKF